MSSLPHLDCHDWWPIAGGLSAGQPRARNRVWCQCRFVPGGDCRADCHAHERSPGGRRPTQEYCEPRGIERGSKIRLENALPIFAQDVLHVGARGYGFLSAAPAVGSVLTALVMARVGTFHRQGRLVVVSVAVFGLATAAFGVSRVFWFSLLMLALTGAADTVSTVLRQTIRQLATPNYLRGRMTSINMMFFMGGPQLGELEAGIVASLIGAPLSVVTGGVGSLVCACIAAWRSKSLMEYDGQSD